MTAASLTILRSSQVGNHSPLVTASYAVRSEVYPLESWRRPVK